MNIPPGFWQEEFFLYPVVSRPEYIKLVAIWWQAVGRPIAGHSSIAISSTYTSTRPNMWS
jgi:hypothetical protein